MPPKFGGGGAIPQPRSAGGNSNGNQARGQQQHQQQQGGNANSKGQDAGRHTIMLIQSSSDVQSRTYTDHESVNEAMRALISVFEAKQMARVANGANGSYTTDQLLGFVDSLHDLSMLCFDRGMRAYVPFDRKFIKDKLYLNLSRQSGQR